MNININKEILQILIPFFTILTALFLALIRKYIPVEVFIWSTIALFIVYAALWAIRTWVYVNPKTMFDKITNDFDQIENKFSSIYSKYESLHKKLDENALKIIVQKQFIDQDTLSLIEEKAKEIWVVTTDLGNEIRDYKLRRTVYSNLQKGIKYIYFIPPLSIPNNPFSEVVKNFTRIQSLMIEDEFGDPVRNESGDILMFFEDNKDNIEFVELPSNTQFLMTEVVIYNPEEEPPKLTGFTYYENSNSEEPLHLRIEGKFLKFFVSQLYAFKTRQGLQIAIKNILIDFNDILLDKHKAFCADLLLQNYIVDKVRYDNIIQDIKQINEENSKMINNRLKEFIR